MKKKLPADVAGFFKKLPPDVLKFFKSEGAKGGRKGGRARAEALTPERRKEIAIAAAKARWGTKK